MRTVQRHCLRALIGAGTTVLVAGALLVPVAQPAFAAGGPSNTVPPALSDGFATVGQAITTDDGTWTHNGALSFTYQWVLCDAAFENCSDIGGATTNSYTPVNGDSDSTVKVRVSATDDDGTTPNDSETTVDVVRAPSNTITPAITGATAEGQTLTTDDGAWDGSNTGSHPMTFQYQWQRCNAAGVSCANFGSDNNIAILGATEVGKRIKATVTATNDAGSAVKTSTLTAVVTTGAPAGQAGPTIGGNFANGNTVQSSDGTWGGTAPITFHYTWLQCDSGGANCNPSSHTVDANSYVIDATDLGGTVKVTVTAHNAVGDTDASSNTSSVVTINPPANTNPPSLSGLPAVGEAVSVDNGTWDGVTPIDYTYQWERCDVNGLNCVDIAGETASTYILQSADIDSKVGVVVTATNDDGNSSAESNHTQLVAEISPILAAVPTVTGTMTRGQTLSSDDAAWIGSPPITFTYSWRRCDSSGASCNTEIGTANTHLLVSADAGHRLRMHLTATNAAGAATIDSLATPLIAATEPDAPVAPTVTPGNGQISVAFVAPDTGGSAITLYTAACTSSNGGAAGNNTGASTPIVVSALDNAKTYTCTVHATNVVGDSAESAASAATVPSASTAPANTVPPTVTGTATLQRTLTAHKGTWTGTPAPTYTYRWQRCSKQGTGCVNIAGATHTTYALVLADLDKTIRVVVYATNIATTTAAVSAVTHVVTTVPVSISGPYYYTGTTVKKAGAGVVGTTTHGNTAWTVTANGKVAGPQYGNLVGVHLQKPIIGIQVTPDGKGYWLFGADGGIFGFGNAHYYGSTGSYHLNAPIVAMQPTPNGKGYWLFAADGGVFGFGNAHYYGSTGSVHLAHPVVAMLATASGKGYWLVTADGTAFHYGDAPNIGRVTGHTDIVGLVSTGAGFRFVTAGLKLLAPH